MSHGPRTGYLPDESELAVITRDSQVDKLLLVGESARVSHLLSEIEHTIRGVRLLQATDAELPRGLYWFNHGKEVMLVGSGSRHGDPSVIGDGPSPAEHPLNHAEGWMNFWWDEAVPVAPPAFALHDEALVLPSGEIVTLRSRSFVNGRWAYEARVDGRMQMLTESSLRTLPEVGGPQAWVGESPVPARRLAATVTRAKLRDRFTDTVFSFRATRTLFRSYQFKPIMKVLQTGRSRLLIADEVGLGKTIEAGLVWTELEARGEADRVLIVCPSVLIPKWQAEMEDRFGFELIELDGEGLRIFAARLEAGKLASRAAYVVSMQRLRGWQGLDELANLRPSFDLIVVDEAHNMRNPETKSFALGSLLSEWATSLVLLTATPVNLRSRDLHSLLRLLIPGEIGDAATFELQLEPNAVLHSLQLSLFDREASAESRIALLGKLGELTFGLPLLGRPEARMLRGILEEEVLTPSDVARARRLLQELNTNSAVVTRTRKVEV